jgi:hypothetical protein
MDLRSKSFLHRQSTTGRSVFDSLTLTPFPIEYATKLAIQTVSLDLERQFLLSQKRNITLSGLKVHS